MVQILPRFDPGGEIGKAFGSGASEALGQFADRRLLQGGIQSVQDMITEARDSGQELNPLDVTLSLSKALANKPGGLQALADLAKPLQEEVLRQNLMIREKNKQRTSTSDRREVGFEKQPGQEEVVGDVVQSKSMPQKSVIEGEEIVQQGRAPEELSVEDQWEAEFQKNLEYMQPSKAAEIATTKMTEKGKEQSYRFKEQKFKADTLDTKIADNFPQGISAPLKNDLAVKFFQLSKRKDVNTAWEELLPKYRAAQVAEENLKNASGSNRPLIFTGDLEKRKEHARDAIKPIADIDPEYAMGLVMNDLDYGPSEAADIIRPGDENFKKFVSQFPQKPDEMALKYATGSLAVPNKAAYMKDYQKYVQDSQKKVEAFLKNKFNPQEDSLLSLRGHLYDKGLPDEAYRNAVKAAFPKGEKDPRLSDFNKHEMNKLSEPTVPGLQEMMSNVLRNFSNTVQKFVEGTIRGKK